MGAAFTAATEWLSARAVMRTACPSGHGDPVASGLLAALEHRPELLGGFLHLHGRIATSEEVRQADAHDVAELCDRQNDRQAELADLAGFDHRVDPGGRHFDS